MTIEEAIEVLTNHTQYKCNGNDLVALDTAIEALRKLSDIQQIIESPVYIQEDVIRYKMICEIMSDKQ